jgi:hypothetical protein
MTDRKVLIAAAAGCYTKKENIKKYGKKGQMVMFDKIQLMKNGDNDSTIHKLIMDGSLFKSI